MAVLDVHLSIIPIFMCAIFFQSVCENPTQPRCAKSSGDFDPIATALIREFIFLLSFHSLYYTVAFCERGLYNTLCVSMARSHYLFLKEIVLWNEKD